MTSGNGVRPLTRDLIQYLTPEAQDVVAKLVRAAETDRTFDVPLLANRSNDGTKVYIDRGLPATMKAAGKEFDPGETLPWHELAEWHFMHRVGLPFDSAHRLATFGFEKPAVERLGLNWPGYQEAMGGEIEANEKRVPKRVPPDIDMLPYVEEEDHKHVRELLAAGADHMEPVKRMQDGLRKIAGSGPRLVPVDHDPFAGEASV